MVQGRIQEFRKGGASKGAKSRTERRRRERRRGVWGPPPENFRKLDAISCNLAHIFGIRMASESKLGLCRRKNSSGHDFDSHTHAYTLTLLKTPRISATIKSKFNFKNIFQTLYTMWKNKIDFAKNRGGRAPLDPPLWLMFLQSSQKHQWVLTSTGHIF